MMGVSKQTIAEHHEYFEQMLGSIGGRMYYNLSSWHLMISLLPAYQLNGPFLEQMMGIDPKHQGSVTSPRTSKSLAALMTVFTSLRIIFIFLTMGLWQRYFNWKFERQFAHFQNLLGQDLPIKTMLEYYLQAEDTFTRDFRIPIANDFAVMVSTGLLRKQIDAPDLYADSNVKSAEPGKYMAQLIQTIQDNEHYRQLFVRSNTPEEILTRLTGYAELEQMISHYIREYGYRVPGELKLESVTFMNEPSLIIRFLQQHTKRTNVITPSDIQLKHQKSVASQVKFLKRLYLRWLTAWARRSITRREQTRFQRTLIFGLTRDTFLKLGQKLKDEGQLKHPRDIFYLTIEELSQQILHNTPHDLKKLAALRQKEATYFETLDIPEHLEVDAYPVKSLMKFERKHKQNAVHKIHGRVASNAGQTLVSGTALTLTTFDQHANFEGKILITRQSDPGWTIVFHLVKGIVVERCGLLSHAAIVAREFGIPCIIGASDATASIPDGATVQMNVETGEVTWKK